MTKDEALKQAITIIKEALAQPETVAWRKMDDTPKATGRYIVSHQGRVGGDAYYIANAGDTHYPVGWAQVPDWKPTHWIAPPLNGELTPPPKREPLTDKEINDLRLSLDYDIEDLPDPWDFKQGIRAAERAYGIKEKNT